MHWDCSPLWIAAQNHAAMTFVTLHRVAQQRITYTINYYTLTCQNHQGYLSKFFVVIAICSEEVVKVAYNKRGTDASVPFYIFVASPPKTAWHLLHRLR